VQIEDLRIIPKPTVISLRGVSKSTHKRQVEAGLYLPPIILGERTQGYLESEFKKLQSAIIGGINNNSLKKLVAEMLQERKNSVAG